MPSEYTFTDYSVEWPSDFKQEADRLRTLLGAELLDVHHIGSTSVPGLAAKSIIDVLPVVRSITKIDNCTPMLREAGYRARGEYGLAGRRYFTRDRGGMRTHNIHIYELGHPDVDRHLAFCAYLRSHEEVRYEYEVLKQEVYARHPADIAAYNDGKNSWVKEVEQMALEWYRQEAS